MSDVLNEQLPGLTALEQSEWRFVTNRYNLLEILSSGLIAPHESLTKPYGRLLQSASGRLPLLQAPAGSAVLEQVTAGGRANFPVVLRLGQSSLIGTPEPLIEGAATVDWCIPTEAVTQIVFPDERSIREFRARQFSNVPESEASIVVDPEEFTADGLGQTLLEALNGLQPATPKPWDLIDRVRGGVGGLCQAVTTADGVAVLGRVLGAGDQRAEVAPWLTEDSLLRVGIQSESPADPETAIYVATLTVLDGTDPTKDWKPRAVLDAVRDAASDSVISESSGQVERNLQSVESILIGDREFQPFRGGSEGLTTAKALLLVLLRNDLTKLLAWPDHETGADESTRMTAAAFAGRLRGVSREQLAARNPLLDRYTARWASRACGADVSLPRVSVAPSGEEGQLQLGLMVGDLLVVRAPELPPSPYDIYSSQTGKDRDRLRLNLARHMGWRELIQSEVRFHGAVDLDVKDGLLTAIGKVAEVHELVEEGPFLQHLGSLEESAAGEAGLWLKEALQRQPIATATDSVSAVSTS